MQSRQVVENFVNNPWNWEYSEPKAWQREQLREKEKTVEWKHKYCACGVFLPGYTVLGAQWTLQGKGSENWQECPAHCRNQLSNTNQSYAITWFYNITEAHAHIQCMSNAYWMTMQNIILLLTWTMIGKNRILGSKEESHELSSLQEK